MNKIWTFAGCCSLLIAAVFGLSSMTVALDLYSLTGPNFVYRMEDMPLPSRAILKLRHARKNERYDIGLFGSSRILMVGRHDVPLPGCRIFNFALGGQSIRWTAGYLELLARYGKLPRLSIVSVDNFDLEFFHNPSGLPLSARWQMAARDVWTGIVRADIGWTETARMAWRHLSNESLLLTGLFQPRYVLHGLRQLFRFGENDRLIGGIVEVVVDPKLGYRSDGSRNIPVVAPDQPEEILPQSPKILPGYLRYDLERLARLNGDGTRILVYESPLSRPAVDFFKSNPNPHAVGIRKEFFRNCRALGIDCRAAPTLAIAEGHGWYNYNHAPGPDLGRYIATLANGHMGPCSRDL